MVVPLTVVCLWRAKLKIELLLKEKDKDTFKRKLRKYWFSEYNNTGKNDFDQHYKELELRKVFKHLYKTNRKE